MQTSNLKTCILVLAAVSAGLSACAQEESVRDEKLTFDINPRLLGERYSDGALSIYAPVGWVRAPDEMVVETQKRMGQLSVLPAHLTPTMQALYRDSRSEMMVVSRYDSVLTDTEKATVFGEHEAGLALLEGFEEVRSENYDYIGYFVTQYVATFVDHVAIKVFVEGNHLPSLYQIDYIFSRPLVKRKKALVESSLGSMAVGELSGEH